MELRAGYKQTELGVIPEEWEILPFQDLLDFRNGINADKSAYGKGLPFVNVLEIITKGHLKASDIPGRVTITKNVAEVFSIRLGSMVFNRSSETPEEVGLSAVYLDTQPAVFGGFVIRGQFKSDAVDPMYSGYAFRALAIRKQIVARGQGAIRANIGQVDLKKVVAPIPPLLEQRAIATALSDVDALLSKIDQLIAKKRALKQATMQQLLTGQTRLPGFSGVWELKRLGDAVEIRKGQLITEKTVVFGEIPVIAGGKKPAYFHNEPNRIGKTITVSASGASAGYVALFDRPIFASDCSTISEGKNYSIEFVFFQMQLHQDAIYRAQTGGAQPHIHAVDLAPIEIGCPELEEQTAIANVLSDMDAELAALEARRDKTRALKQGMMQALLTGRIRLI